MTKQTPAARREKLVWAEEALRRRQRLTAWTSLALGVALLVLASIVLASQGGPGATQSGGEPGSQSSYALGEFTG